MTDNPYEPPPLPAERPRRQPRPKSPYGYAMAVLLGALLGGIVLDTPMIWQTGLMREVGMTIGAVAGVLLYHCSLSLREGE